MAVRLQSVWRVMLLLALLCLLMPVVATTSLAETIAGTQSGSANEPADRVLTAGAKDNGLVTLEALTPVGPQGQLPTEALVTFGLRLNNSTEQAIIGLIHGLRVYSPDGATWGTITPETTGVFTSDMFDLLVNTDVFGVTGSGSDTASFGAVAMLKPGMVVGFDGVPFRLTVGPIDPMYVGSTICIDSCWIPPAGDWFWVPNGQPDITPDWGGPYCFEIYDPPGELVISPNSLEFEAEEFGPDPEPQAFDVAEFYGRSIPFSADFLESEFLILPEPTGTTPGTCPVEVSVEGLAAGDYYADVLFSSPDAPGDPVVGTVHLVVHPFDVDSLIVPSTTMPSNAAVQPVVLAIKQPAKGATVSLDIPPDVFVWELSTEGLITESWDYVFTEITSDHLSVTLANSFGQVIPAGSNTIFNIKMQGRWCADWMPIRWDTAMSGDPLKRTAITKLDYRTVLPGFDFLRDESEMRGYTPGDANSDGLVDIADLVFMVNWMFKGGPSAAVPSSLDVNGDCFVDVSDLVKMVDHMFLIDGPTLDCGCVDALPGAPKIAADITLAVSHEAGATIVHVESPVRLRGVELHLEGSGAHEPILCVGGGMELLSLQADNHLHVGVVDMDGGGALPSGDYALIRLEGDYEVVSATITNGDYQSLQVPVAERDTPAELPSEFRLGQNYPNPFNPDTRIELALPSACHVELAVFNLMGQRVATLADRYFAAGTHSISWLGCDDSGNPVASGVYFYRLKTEAFTETRKMMLMK